jgi:hypothetical protein
MALLMVRFPEIYGQTLQDRHPRHDRGRILGSARIVPYLRSCGSAAWKPPYSVSSSSLWPSNGSLNCTGSLYGASSASGLGGWGLGGGFSTSRSVGQPLADDASDRALGARYVINAELCAVAVTEIKLGQIAMQMGFADVEVAAVNPALEDREEPLDGIGVCFDTIRKLARPLLFSVVHCIVSGKALADAAIGAQFVGHQPALGIRPADNHATEGRGSDVLDLAGACPAAALDEGDDRHSLPERRFCQPCTGCSTQVGPPSLYTV